MKHSLNNKTILFGTLMIGLTMVSCGQATPAQLSSTTSSCLGAAASKHASAYDKAEKAYDYAMVGCQQLIIDEQYTVYARCTKAAENSRRDAKAEADRNLDLDKQACAD